jgi:hypothetical protein
MKVPLLDLRAQFAPIRDEVLSAIVRVCDEQRFIMGPEVAMPWASPREPTRC